MFKLRNWNKIVYVLLLTVLLYKANGQCTIAGLQIVVSNDTICAGTQTDFLLVGATSFTLNPGNVVSNFLFSVSPTVTTVYTITATSGTCTATTTTNIFVLPIPSQPGSIIGNTLVPIPASLQSYSISPIPGATSYNWSLPAGWSGSSTTNSISIGMGAAYANTLISVSATNSCGIGPTTTLAVTSYTCNAPNQPSAIIGNTLVLEGSIQTYSTLPVPGATSYNWLFPADWTGSSITNTISVTVGNTSGYIAISAINSCNWSSYSNVLVTVTSTCVVPGQPTAIVGNTLVPANSVQTFSVAPDANATSYEWYILPSVTPASTSNTVSVNVGNTTNTLLVVAQNSCGVSPNTTLLINIATESQTCSVTAQDWNWVKSIGIQNTSNAVSDLATDNYGNTYITGAFATSTLVIGSTTLSNTGGSDAFLAKYDKYGNVLWAKSGTSSSSTYDKSWGVTTDQNNNVTITGIFTGINITFDGTTLSCPNNGQNIFVVKYDSQGNLLWARSIDFTNTLWMRDITTDNMGNIFITGNYSWAASGITFGSITLNAYSNTNPFVVKYDSNGNAIWAKGSTSTLANWSEGIATDNQGNVFITGNYSGNSSDPFTFGGITLPNTTSRNIFLIKLDNAGNAIWAKTGVGNSNGGGDYGFGVATDNSGNVIVTGFIESTSANFGSVTITNSNNNSSRDIFVVKYDAAGNLLWAKNAGGLNSDAGQKVACDNLGNIYISGYIESKPAVFDGITITKNSGTNYSTFFVAKYAASGAVIWVKQAENTDANSGNEKPSGIDVDSCGNVYVSSVAYDNSSYGALSLVKGGIFVAKLGDEFVGIDELIIEGESFSIMPNPTTGILNIKSDKIIGKGTIEVLNIQGQTIYKSSKTEQQIDLSNQPKGIYFLQINSEDGIINKKIILQ
jgi:hypothetical protein